MKSQTPRQKVYFLRLLVLQQTTQQTNTSSPMLIKVREVILKLIALIANLNLKIVLLWQAGKWGYWGGGGRGVSGDEVG